MREKTGKRDEDLLAGFLEDLRVRGRTPRTLQNYKSSIRTFLEFLGKKSPRQAGQDELRRFLDTLATGEQKLSPQAISLYFSALASFYSWLEFEERVATNPVPKFRRRYLDVIQREARKSLVARRQLLSVEDMRRLAHSILDVRDRAILVLSAKTGIRRQELINIDVADVDWREGSIELKAARKRTNKTVFFDDEAARVLRAWLPIRAARGANGEGALFTNRNGGRITRNDVYYTVTAAAEKIGLHDAKGGIKKKFTPHACRHFFTTYLKRAGMPPEYVAWLRGDAPGSTQDLYNHIDPALVREAYRARIPQLGV
jgi:integrase/recombinase XerD